MCSSFISRLVSMQRCIQLITIAMLLGLNILACNNPDSGGSGNPGPSNSTVLITEVSSNPGPNAEVWFEIYNPGPYTVNLSNYEVRVPLNTLASKSILLPGAMVTAGNYAIIRGMPQSYTPFNTHRQVFIGTTEEYPDWEASGYVELIATATGETIDYVSFGSNTVPAADPTAWLSVNAPTIPSGENFYGYTLARDASNTDTDQNIDWTVRSFATTGAPNDVTCTTDNDADGIPDCSEQPGSTFAGLPLYNWGARVNQPDIFIEVDYMNSSDEGITPRQEALAMVVEAFARQGISVHFDVGDLYHQAPGISPSEMDLGGGNQVPYAISVGLGRADLASDVYVYKQEHMDLARKQVFHYMFFGSSSNASGEAGSSGFAEVNGNDSLISLGNWGLNSQTTSQTNFLINTQATTVMHELGHNLGLRHGGFENRNFKPNYLSVMNYLYQLSGLDSPGTVDEGDRYLEEFFRGDTDCGEYTLSTIANSPYSNTFIIDYSYGSSAVIDEDSTHEDRGLYHPDSGSVDYNCNGSSSNRLDADINGNGTLNELLEDYDDWGNINLFFARYANSNTDEPLIPPIDSVTANEWFDVVNSDRQELSIETPPSDSFFAEIKAMARQAH